MSYRKTIATLSAIAASGALAGPAAAHNPYHPSGHDVSGGSAPSGLLQSIAQCESGGDPSAIGGGGLYRGKYQFTFETWASVGGTGDPAAAPESEQDKRAAILLAQSGTSPWPVCGS